MAYSVDAALYGGTWLPWDNVTPRGSINTVPMNILDSIGIVQQLQVSLPDHDVLENIMLI